MKLAIVGSRKNSIPYEGFRAIIKTVLDLSSIDADFRIKLISFNKRKGIIEVADASTKSWYRVTHFTPISELTPHQLLYLYDIVEQTVLNINDPIL